MGRRTSVALATLFALAFAAPAAMAAREPLNAYRVAPTADNKSTLALAGYDMTEADHGSYLEVYGTARQIAALKRDEGIKARLVGRTRSLKGAAATAALPPVGSDAAYNVWRRYDKVPNDNKEQYLELYDRLEGKSIVKKVQLGTTVLGRPIIALKVTKNAKAQTDNTRPAVLYNSMQHAREWLAGETCKRTLLYFTENYGKDTDAGHIVTPLVDSRELWFSCVSNPDGYEYTFTPGNRLWRKNMADNNGNGIYGEVADGVDPNRNFATNWGRDNEGSSDSPLSETYRGTGPDSEAETKAMKKLWDMVDFRFQKNDHTAAELLLYPEGFQQYTQTPDNGIFEALAGDDDQSAIADKVWNPETETWDITGNRFDPDLGAELYITNGDTLDDAYSGHHILGFTPEGSEPDLPNVSGFEFQDVEADIEAEFQRHRLFALDLAESAADPGNPVSHMGNTVRDFYVQPFADSYGDPQSVQVIAKRSLGDVKVRYRINDGSVKTAPTQEWADGERYYDTPGIYYHRLRGVVTGTDPGDEVEVWFEGGRKSSSHFTYTARRESGAKLLILSAENYTAGVPAQDPTGPHYLTYYTDALDELGVEYDVYDVDKRGNRSPDALGVLSHYDAVVWYLGDDYLTRQPGQGPGTGHGAPRGRGDDRRPRLPQRGRQAVLHRQERRPAVRGGQPVPQLRLPGGLGGRRVLQPQRDGGPAGVRRGRPDAGGRLHRAQRRLPPVLPGGVHLRCARQHVRRRGGPSVPDGRHRRVRRPRLAVRRDRREQPGPLGDLRGHLVDPGPGALPALRGLPQRGRLAASRGRAVQPVQRDAVHERGRGQHVLQAARQDGRPDRRDRAPAELQVLRGRRAGVGLGRRRGARRDDRPGQRRLDDAARGRHGRSGHADTSLTTQSTGDSCPEGLATDSDAPHPFLLHYWSATCEPTGTTGDWHAFTGSSGGWDDWTVDLSAYAGKQVDLRISVITDWGTLGLGAWVDDWNLTDGATTLEFNDFEQPLDASWQIGPPPEGTDNPTDGWTRRGQQFTEGGVVATDDTVFTGFGFEGINESARTEFLRRTLTHLGVLAAGAQQPVSGGAAQAGSGDQGRRRGQEGPGLREDQVRPQAPPRSQGSREGADRRRGRRGGHGHRPASRDARHDAVRREAVQRPRRADEDGQGEAAQEHAQGAPERQGAAGDAHRQGHGLLRREHRGAPGGPAQGLDRNHIPAASDGPPPGGPSRACGNRYIAR